MKNRKLVILAGMISLLVFCKPAPQDDQGKLAMMESKRDALNEQIDILKKKIAQEKPSAPDAGKTINVKIAPLEKSEFKHFVQVQGVVESDNNILIAPQSSGVVKRIYVSSGKRIQKGQILAELDRSILESSIDEVKNGLRLAKTVFERQERLWNKKIGSEIEYLLAKNNKESLEKKLVTLGEQVKLTKIFAPISGTVDEVLLKKGEMGVAGMGAFRLVQLSRLKIKLQLSENYITQVNKGDQVFVQIPVIGKELKLKIESVSQVIDPKNRTFQIEIKIPRNEIGIKPNMLAVLKINDYFKEDAIIVPGNIIQETGEGSFLFIAAQSNNQWIAEKRIITTGKNYGGQTEILSGIKADDHIIVLGYQNLANGQKLNVTIDN